MKTLMFFTLTAIAAAAQSYTATSGRLDLSAQRAITIQQPASGSLKVTVTYIDITCESGDRITPCLVDQLRCPIAAKSAVTAFTGGAKSAAVGMLVNSDAGNCSRMSVQPWRIQPGKTFRFRPRAVLADDSAGYTIRGRARAGSFLTVTVVVDER